MSTLIQDLRYGARAVVHHPGFSLIIVLTLALAIGANTVAFSFTNILVVRPLPVRDQETLGWIFMVDPQRGGDRVPLSIPDLLDYRTSLQSFTSIGGTHFRSITMSGRGDAIALAGTAATANLFDTWGLQMRLGRSFAEGADRPGGPDEVVLSHQFWQRQFAADEAIVGQALTLDGRPFTVTGVLQPNIEIGNLSTIDVWVPLTLDGSVRRDLRNVRVSARLKPGVSLETADAEVRALAQRLQVDHPKTNAGWNARVARTHEAMTGSDTWIILALLTLVVAFVLLIACANIANLVLARATGRRRELAVRAALGASRLRMVRQLLTESVLLGILGGTAGLAVAYAGLSVIKAAAYEPFFELVVIDRNVLLFTGLLSLLSPIVFTLLPALHASKTDLNDALKDSSTRAGGGVRGRRSRSVLVVSQLSLAMMLLIVATLLVRSMMAITRSNIGFDPSGLLTVRLDLPEWRYKHDASLTDYSDRMLARIRAIRGVQHASIADRLPVLGGETPVQLTIAGYAPQREEDRPWGGAVSIGEGFLATAGIPIVAGREFDPTDNAERSPVAIVNDAMARKYWGDPGKALGGRVSIDGDPRGWLEVVGVAGNVKTIELENANPLIYRAARQTPLRSMAVLVRTADPDQLLPFVRSELTALDRDVPLQQLRTVREAFDDELSSLKILTGMFAAFAVIALTLAAAGLYGVISYSVSQRTQEISIRLALGASGRQIRGLVVRQTALLIAVGCALGLLGGIALAQSTSALLYDVSASDPSTYFAVAVTLAAVAALAAVLPMRRAIRVDPALTLRGE